MMLSAKIINQIKQIQLKAGFLTTDAMVGEYSSAFKGLGQEFDKVREYFQGDDIRSIDWNVTARMGEPFVKVYKEERELTLILMVDVSPSQRFGTSKNFKQEVSAELIAILAFLAIKNNDKVGLIVFSDHVEQYIPPKKGRAHVWSLIRSILTHKSEGKKTDLNGALNFLLQVCKKKSLCFLVSDFETQGFEKSLKIASRRHDLTCVYTEDIAETDLPNCGVIDFQDSETGECFSVDTSNPKDMQALKDRAQKDFFHLQTLFRKNKIRHFQVNTRDSVVTPLVSYIRQREKS